MRNSEIHPKKDLIFVAGHKGMVGSAVCRFLKKKNFNLLTVDKNKVNLENFYKLEKFFKKNRPSIVIMAAAKVGGIYANNTYPVEFLLKNTLMQNNIISLSHKYKVKRLIFLGSSCIFPLKKKKLKETDLLNGKLEPTNEAYSIAKISGIKLCEFYNKQYNNDFRSVMPCNLYGPGDNYNLKNSHVLPALIRKIHAAMISKKKQVVLWGKGIAIREFMHVDDLVLGIFQIMIMSKKRYNAIIKKHKISFINFGTGYQISINRLALIIKKVINYKGKIVYDKNYPDGNLFKVLDSRIAKLFWKPSVSLVDGIKNVYSDFLLKKDLRK